MIEVKDLTLKYPGGKGVFGLDFSVGEGEVMGYLGPNGSGKTTTMRGLLGFMRPDGGSCAIGGLDCFLNAPEIQRSLGYIPGESAFPEGMRGEEFLKFMAEMRGTKDSSRQKQLLERFELQPKGNVKKFSKGMKQKLAIVAAFMHDPQVIILDEPTSGLDPLMQNRFVELVLEEKKRGKTILMSSHMFEEVERTCENVLIIKDGKIVTQSDIATLKSAQRKGFVVTVQNIGSALSALTGAGFEVRKLDADSLEVFMTGQGVDRFVKTIAAFPILALDAKAETLETVFMHFYGEATGTGGDFQ